MVRVARKEKDAAMAERPGGRRRSRRDSVETGGSLRGTPPTSKERRTKRSSKPSKERWLLTRKTWRYMADAGRRLIPDGAHNRPEDIPKIEQYFQEVCQKEPRFLLWRKASYPGTLGFRSQRRRRQVKGGSCRTKASSADEADEVARNPPRGFVTALCNILAIKECKMVMNASHEIQFDNFKEIIKEDISDKDKEDSNSNTVKSFHYTATHTSNSNIYTSSQELKKDTQELSIKTSKFISTPVEISSSFKSIASQIKPTKTFGKEEIKNETSISILEIEETIQAEVLTTVPVSLNVDQRSILKASEEPFTTPSISIENSPQTTVSVSITTTDSNEFANDDMISDIESLEFANIPNKVEKEYLEQEGKQEQVEISDQEIKLPSQDSLMFDNLLSDLKVPG